MEEILASIRRIIADDDPSPNAQASSPTQNDYLVPPPARPTTASAEPAQPMDAAAVPLREPTKAEIDAMLAQLRGPSQMPYPQEPASEPDAGELRLPPAGSATGDDASPLPPAERAIEPPAQREFGLLSAAAATEIGSAFARLAQADAAPKGPTLEELVSEMLRPMLKTWLEENLPAMVERLVQAEIERVTRKG